MTEILVSRIINILFEKKGFYQDESHHTMLRLVADGRKTRIHTWFSHGRKKADDWLLSQIAKELRLSKKEFFSFIDCTMSQDEYTRLMTERGHIR